jgi:hypothetical protein
MSNIIPFPKPLGIFAASLDLFLEPDGTVLARLNDMDPKLIETMGGEVSDKLLKLAEWAMQASESLAEQADALRLPS